MNKNEEKILNILKNYIGNSIKCRDGKTRFIKDIGKPIVSHGGGEPVTDICVIFHDDVLWTISLKQPTYGFVRNKITYNQCISLLGENFYNNILPFLIEKALKNINNNKYPIIQYDVFNQRNKRTADIVILQGYRLDIVDTDSGDLTFPFDCPSETFLKIFSGSDAQKEKKDCVVNGHLIPNSGVAKTFLVKDLNGTETPQELYDMAEPIETMQKKQLYISFRAVNYFHYPDKNEWKGDTRYLAIYSVFNPILNNFELCYDKPLQIHGDAKRKKYIKESFFKSQNIGY